MEWTAIHDALFQKVEQEMNSYEQKMEAMTSGQVFARAYEIAAMTFCYNQIVGHITDWPVDDLEYLLRFQNPLEVVRDQWTAGFNATPQENIGHTLWELRDKRDAEVDYELDPDWHPQQDGSDGPSMC